MDAPSAVATSAMVTITSTVSASILPTKYGGKGQIPPARLLIGSGLAFFGLSILADISANIAKPLAAGVAVTALTYYGVPIMDNYFVYGKAHDTVGSPRTAVNTDGPAGPAGPTGILQP